MERIIYERIYASLETRGILSKFQYGFRASRGTNDAVFKLVNDIYYARDRDECLLACFLDVRKAFDSIHHLELIARMKSLELTPPLHRLALCLLRQQKSKSCMQWDNIIYSAHLIWCPPRLHPWPPLIYMLC